MPKLSNDFSRHCAPEQDDVVIASSLARNNGTLFWTVRSAANLALKVEEMRPKDPVMQAHVRQLLGHLKELGAVSA